jgi:two-component system chemotaxis sensor kinase CheA
MATPRTISIRVKLALLAGVPVIGALLLALLVANDARQRAASAASLGSIEDLARLTSYIADVLHAVQDERAVTSIAEGLEASKRGTAGARATADARRGADASAARLEAFLASRDRSKLPPRLARGLTLTESALRELSPLRSRADVGGVDLQEVLARYGAVSSGLVSATAALAELSDDGAMLRNISAIVALLELEERASVEDAIVGYAAARGEFPPGAFKALVTTTTEESVYDEAFRTSASDEVRRIFEDARQRGHGGEELLEGVLKSTEDTVSLEPAAWRDARGAAMRELRAVEGTLLGLIESAAATKGSALKKTVRLGLGVAIAVIFLSVMLAVFVRRGIQGSVQALADAAERVRSSRDFSVRARRVSNDELGMLTETFNEMLGGIQSRDAELEQHRSHLEALVDARTRELASRNEAMRLVLDNVDQGLATIGVNGTLHSERSGAFDRWFDASTNTRFHEALLSGDERTGLLLQLGWEQVVEGFLPPEVSLEQLPKRFDRDGRHFTLAIKPILREGAVTGALLIVSDVTSEQEARQEQARQREELRIFQRIAGDKAGFLAFIEETGSIVERLRTDNGLGAAEQLALVHTVKGNAAQCEVRSVADAAHELESSIAETHAAVGRAQLFPLFRAWDAIGLQVGALVDRGRTSIEITQGELDRLIDSVKKGAPASELVSRLLMFHDEPVAARFARLGEHAERLATRLGKPVPRIDVQTGDLRLPRSRFASLWASLVHVVRNAVDHGVEDAGARAAAGKPDRGTLSFRARVEERGGVVIEIADDGAGIDWGRLAAKARAAGLPADLPDDLERAVFASGISSLDAVTETSGRGVGLAAVWDTTTKLGGTVKVASERGKGTRFVLRLPFARESNRGSVQPIRMGVQ